MKKLLLSMAFASAAFGFASAHEASVTFSALGFQNAEDVTSVKVNDDITLTFDKGTNSNSPKYYTTGTGVRLYGSNTLTVQGVAGVEITEVVFTTAANTSSASYQINAASSVTVGTLAPGDVTTTWTGDANSFTLTQGGTTGHARIQSISFTYTGGTGTGGTVVTPVEPNKVGNIEAFLTLADATNPTEITSPVTAVYQNGRYLYLTDATGDLLVYGDLDTQYSNGDLIPAGITGKFQNFSDGLLQMSSPEKATFKAATAGTAVQPEELTVEEVATDMVNHYVVLKNVSIAATETANTYTLTDETGEIVLYNTFYSDTYYTVVDVLEGEELNVEGFVSVHSGVAQITPVRVWSASGLEAVAAPTFNPASGTVEEGTEVTISCATEGASIYYTLDNSTPSAESTLYTAPIVITEATSIRAIAIKEGMANSAVANASYVVEKPFVIEGDAQFNFEKPETLSPAQTAPDSATPSGANIDGIAFTSNGVTVEFSAGSSGTRLYYGFNTGVEARLYKTGTVSITAPEGNPITKVEFYGAGIGNLSVDGVAVADNVWSSAEGAAKVVATAVAGQETDNGRVDFKGIGVTLQKSGVVNVEFDTDAPVEYYNLQGVRVENPANGLYIRRQGNNVSKVIL